MLKNFPFRQIVIFAAYVLIGCLITWPAVTQLSTHIIGTETGDSFEMARNVWYFSYALQTGEPLLYQPLLGYPDGISGTVFITVIMQYAPMSLLALFLPLPLSYNLVVIAYMALNGWAMYWLMRYWLRDGSHVPAFIAGLIYMAFPVFQAHLAEGHGGLMVGFGVPLLIWSTSRMVSVNRGVWRWLLASIFFFWLSTSGHILQSIYVLLPIFGTAFLLHLGIRDWRTLRRLLLLGLLAGVLLGLLFLPAILEVQSESAYRDTTGFVRFSADALSLLTPSFLHPVFDALLTYPRRVLGINITEGMAYIGLIAACLSLIALIKRRDVRWWGLIGAVAWVLSLGPVLKIFDQPVIIGGNALLLPLALLTDLPGFNLARTPGRFNFTMALVIAILAGYGFAWLWHRRRRARIWHAVAVIVLSAGILFEYQTFWPMPLRPAQIPQAVYALQARDDLRAVFNVPYANLLAAKDALYLQTAHHLPLIAGQITRQTPVNPAKLALLEETLDPALLRDAGADIVILHHRRADDNDFVARVNAQLNEPIFVDERIAIYQVPDGTTDNSLPDLDGANARQFEGGITLLNSGVLRVGEEAFAYMQWSHRAARAPQDVRFLHVVDADGAIAWQNDTPANRISAGDVLALPLSEFATGDYTVRVGWYRLEGDSFRNYLADDGQAMIEIGTFRRD